jgi:hypothetical protein
VAQLRVAEKLKSRFLLGLKPGQNDQSKKL